MKKGVTRAVNDYKKSDHLMVHKTFGMKDVVYKKSAPSRELWRSEISFDVRFCFLALAAVTAVALALFFAARMWHSVCRTVSRFGTSRRRK